MADDTHQTQQKHSDIYSPEKRSDIMSRVKSKNTKPELLVRSTLHRLGYRFRLHSAELPGKPDIVLPRYHTVVFVHGCFWHQHEGCKKAALPRQNAEFWQQKLSANKERDKKLQAQLKALGWKVLVIWECQAKNLEVLEQQLTCFLEQTDVH